jgi:type I restriction enzyme R subunit
LFSNRDAIDEVIVEPYEKYVTLFNESFEALSIIAPSIDSVDDLYSEEDQMKFILAFRALIRLNKKMSHYTEFDWKDLNMEEQAFADYSSKYQDLKDKIHLKTDSDKTSILEDIDFELELIRKDTINVTYILQLLMRLKANGKKKEQESIEKEIFNLLNSEVTLRSKKELIEKFIKENFIIIADTEDITEEFTKFWQKEQQIEFARMVDEERLSPTKTEKLIEDYLFSERAPLREDVLELIEGDKPGLLERRTTGNRILKRLTDFIETFMNGMSFN